MDIGDCLTNIISTHELTAIKYAYLEARPSPPSSLAVRRLVARWQKEGHVAAHDDSGRGLWLFGSGSADEDTAWTLWGSVPPAGQVLSVEGIDFDVKHKDTYDFQALIESWKAGRRNHNAALPKDAPQKTFTSVQITTHNNQAMATNSAINLFDQTPSRRSDGKEADGLPYLSIGDAHEHFLMALMSSISTMLCVHKSYVPLGTRTLVVPQQNVSSSAVVISGAGSASERPRLLTLDADYTGGEVLVIKATVTETTDLCQFSATPSHLTKTEKLAHGLVVVLAPGGVLGRYMGPLYAPDTSRVANTMLEQNLIFKAGEKAVSSWKHRSIDWLETKGLTTGRLHSEPWLLMEIDLDSHLRGSAHLGEGDHGQPVILPWPSSLCFRRQSSCSKEKQDLMPVMDARDLVEFAQNWLMTEQERVQICHTRKQEREALNAALRSQEHGAIEFQDTSHMTSPLAFRRSSLAGMVYPTPPDAVQIGIGATPTFDGSTSTPGPQGSHHLEMTDHSTFKVDANGAERMDGPLEHSTGGGFSDSNNNLFGDMGDDDFFGIDNGVTDADFSFFDQPDTVMLMDSEDALDDEIHHQTPANVLLDGASRPGPISVENEAVDTTNMLRENIDSMRADANAPRSQAPMPSEVRAHNRGTASVEASSPARDTSPPLKPDMVFRRLSTIGAESYSKNEGSDTPYGQSGRGGDSYLERGLTPAISTFQHKYGPNGRFIYPTKSISPMSIRAGIPTTDYFRRRRQRKLTARVNGSTFPPSLAKHPQEQAGDNSIIIGITGSSHTPRSLSDVDESSEDEDIVTSLGINGKRKRDIDDDGHVGLEEDFMSASLNDMTVRADDLAAEDETIDSFDVMKLDGDSAGWSLARYLAWPDSWTSSPILKDTDFVAAARVLTDQAMSRNFEYTYLNSNGVPGIEPQNGAQAIYGVQNSQQDVMDIARTFFKDAEPCTLSSYLNIRGIPKPLAFGRQPARSAQNLPNNHASGSPQTSVFEIPPPHLEVRRSDSKLTVLPAAIEFWDVLGLAPRSNTKDVSAICLYSNGSATIEEAELFMENMRSAYETKRLGCHERLTAEGFSDGILALDLDQVSRFSSDSGMSFVSAKLAEVLKAIATTELSDRNLVFYFVYEPDDSSASVGICGAFDSVLNRYRVATGGSGANELILQLVPRNLVRSRTKIVIPSPSDFGNLALEVYDRCYNFEIGWPSPSMSIEPPLPRTVDFKPTATPSASLLEENSCLHLAYAQSIDDRWISVAWTDNSGNEQFATSYCLGRKGGSLSRQFQEVANEIWETTLDIISAKKVHWRLMIVKCGPIEPEDTAFWRGLASTESKAQITLTILTVDTVPSLQLIPPEIELPVAGMAVQSAFASSPVSTPQAMSVLSPDSGVPSTPAESAADIKIEADATLLELSDQTYGAILGHELNDRNCLLDLRPTMLSGYLIKRAENAPRVMEVNIIWTEPNKCVLDRLLKEILSTYGALATLARARGVVDPTGDPRPWHIVMAERIVKAMYVLM